MHRSKITLSIPEIQSKFLHISCKNSLTLHYTVDGQSCYKLVLLTIQFVTTLTIQTVYNLMKKSSYKMQIIVLWNSYSQCSILFKEIGDEEPYYSTKILIFSFIWAGLAALHKASTI